MGGLDLVCWSSESRGWRCTRGKLLGWKGGGGVQVPRDDRRRGTGGNGRESPYAADKQTTQTQLVTAEGQREEKLSRRARCRPAPARPSVSLGCSAGGAPHRPPKPALGMSSPARCSANFRSSSQRDNK
ncbi:hypothetical protein VTN00DRAFT_7097 [Thermoascus crustaceus]|uniref:uncharacterized protein n=1 Tax=Thermoascus crustaceus TaxID=5088 RepID=UPI00374228F2